MDGFFDKYGRMIVVAVAICFVLLFLTPMRNVVGSSINGFTGNFANKVGESLGTVKMPDGSDVKEQSSKLITGIEFNNKIPSEAKTVIFTDEKAPKGTVTTDLTVANDRDVVGWLDGTIWKVSTQNSRKVVNFNENSSKMFAEKSGLTNVDFNNIDTSKVTDMSSMFWECSSLTNLNLSCFDTSNVIKMNNMFVDCSNLPSLDLSSFNTSNVTDMTQMFHNCSNLQSVNLSSFDTSKVTRMSGMFHACKNLRELDLSNFNTSNVTSMGTMFNACYNLQSVNLSSFNTSKVTDMDWMFQYCSKLTSLDLRGFDTSKVTRMDNMFACCSNLRTIKARSQTDIEKLKTNNTRVNSSVTFIVA